MLQAENVRGALRNGGVPPLTLQTSERGLLELLVAQLGCLDPDFIVGHNIGNWDLAILLQRMQHHKVLNWSRIGRFRRGRMPSLGGGGTMYGGGASQVCGGGALHHVHLPRRRRRFVHACRRACPVVSSEKKVA